MEKVNHELNSLLHIGEMDDVYDIYSSNYFEKSKRSNSSEAITNIDEHLKESFKENKLDSADKTFEIIAANLTPDNDVQIIRRMKKCSRQVEHFARWIQCLKSKDIIEVLLCGIGR